MDQTIRILLKIYKVRLDYLYFIIVSVSFIIVRPAPYHCLLLALVRRRLGGGVIIFHRLYISLIIGSSQ